LSTTIRRAARAALALALAAFSLGASLPGARAGELKIVVVEREGDPFYDRADGADGLYRIRHDRPFPGAEIGLKDIAALALAVNVAFSLDRWSVSPDEPVADVVKRAAAEGVSALLLDLPDPDLRQAAKALPRGQIALFNIREPGDNLRRDLCATDLFHVIPSRSGLTDALAQFLAKRNWRKILMIVGPEDEDAVLAKSFEGSARKFGARIVDTKPFVEGNDPRNREQTNVALMTSGIDYDAVFVADTVGDFGRYIQYRMSRPRPVIGTEGLQAAAWHFTSERYGAPQVSRRFERLARRPMTALDWSAWVAVRALGEAVARTPARSPGDILRVLRDGQVAIELSKGVSGSFRPWDGQLRQPIMLHTQNAVVDFAPLDGFLHESSTLDTLGLGPRDVPCGSR
jgi:ABC transporter substrate binding protein (PQQ-dependent alcohol dehydrogenase system)